MRHSARLPRGVAMLAVLVALLLMSLLVGAFFLQSRDSSSLTYVSLAQTVASSNAELGLNEAIRRVRATQIDPTLVNACSQAEVDTNACVTLNSGVVSGPAASDLSNGGGVLYQFIVYRRAEPDMAIGAKDNRFVIRSTGFFGQTLTAPGLVTSILEAEVEIGQGNSFECTTGYEC